MTTTATRRTDRYGFPVRTCGRCGGSGQHSYNQMHGSVCYGCNGSGVNHTPKARKQFTAWQAELKAIRKPLAKDVEPGDELAVFDTWGRKITGWRTVLFTVRTTEACGWTIQRTDGGAEIRIPTQWRMTIHFTDETVDHCCTHSIERRRGWIDPAPFVALAT